MAAMPVGPGSDLQGRRKPSATSTATSGHSWARLRRERGAAWMAACDRAEAQGKRDPSLRAYGIPEIKRLARRLGVGATHWLED